MLCLGLAAAMVAGLLYATIVPARKWNSPRAARGLGIALLGLIVVGIAALAESNGERKWAWYLKAAGLAVAVLGGLQCASGMADRQK